MEISSQIVEEALIVSRSVAGHEHLTQLLARLALKDEIVLLKMSDFEATNINQEIFQLIQKTRIHDNEQCAKEIGRVIAAIRPYLERGIYKCNLKDILIFIGVSAYLKIPISQILVPKDGSGVYPREIS